MILKEYDLSIRLPYERTIDTGITLVQNDKDVYKFNVRVFDGVNEIDYSNVTTATITFSKSDKNVVQGDMVVGVDKLTYTLGTNEIACSGKVIVSVQLWGTTERLTTARFLMQVDKDLITEHAVRSTSEFPILQRVVQDVAEIVPLLPDIEQTIQEFPAIRDFFDTAETSETQRNANEATRQSQEVSRQASMVDIEDRFDNLTASQQQDAEVVDARMGKVSLRAKIEDMDAKSAAHWAESASKHIRESGSNTNGSYIKFDDGTMVCYHRATYQDVVMTQALGTAYTATLNYNWVFAAAFTSVPSVSLTQRVYFCDFIWINDITSTTASFRPSAFTSKTNAVPVLLLAIGRWK